jgi:outer membrane protein OmpA-like peptidoglycan-associated protein
VKTRNRTFVDVLAHTDTSGTAQVNKALSDKRAAAVATYLAAHGVAKARIASEGLGETAPLYNPETDETQKAANRRIEIRLVPYRA